MAIAEVFPYSDQHNLNLDWVITKIKEFSGNQISAIACQQIDADTIKFVITYTDGSTKELTEITLPAGPQGATGPTGATPELTAGTVTTLPAGSDATVSITGTAENPVLNLGIPQGIQGETGATGAPGGITNIEGYTGAVTAGQGIAFDTSSGEISSYDLDLTDTGSITMSTLTPPTGIATLGGTLYYALNADHSIGKIYGTPSIKFDTLSGSVTCDIDTGITVPAPDSDYSIITGMPAVDGFIQSGTYVSPPGCNFRIDTDGKVYIRITGNAARSGKSYFLAYTPCLYFFKNFGDE